MIDTQLSRSYPDSGGPTWYPWTPDKVFCDVIHVTFIPYQATLIVCNEPLNWSMGNHNKDTNKTWVLMPGIVAFYVFTFVPTTITQTVNNVFVSSQQLLLDDVSEYVPYLIRLGSSSQNQSV